MSIYQFSVQDAHGDPHTLSEYQGKVLMIVNVASKCGFTPQYTGLQALYGKMREQGFEILGFPCDQFGHQEPGSDAEIQQFCQLNYDVSFPVFSKIEVNGAGAHPLYRYLTSQQKGSKGEAIEWNFTKFLIDREGKPVARFASAVTPEQLSEPIQTLLATK